MEFYYDGQWGTVCSDEWDINDAMVVCKHLGYGKATEVKLYVLRGERMWFDNVECHGDEPSLLFCHYSGSKDIHCISGRAAGVVCGEEQCLL